MVDFYVDADFASLYGQKYNQNPNCVKYSSGYIVVIKEFLFLWAYNL